MQIVFIGDIVGRPGRTAVKHIIPEIKKKYQVDLIIANGENASHGKGITKNSLKELHEAGIDFFTSGNHIWSKPEIAEELDKKNPIIIRPANYPEENPGVGYRIITAKNKKNVLVINVQGNVFMHQSLACPFKTAEKIYNENKKNADAVIVDFHAEATSEKITMKYYLDGMASAVLGTHTHVPTADHHVTEKGTAYISDVGMVGKEDSIIGIDPENIIKRFVLQVPVQHEITAGSAIFNSVLIDIDESNGKARSITPLSYHYSH